MTISRRSLIIGISAVGCAVRSTAAVDLLRPTPQETFGPFFPVHTPKYHDFDMTRKKGPNVSSDLGCAVRSTAAVDLLRPTPQETFGPFFPVHTPKYHDFDMTRKKGPNVSC